VNSRERVLKTLRGEIPDRVPVTEMFIDEKVMHAICPGSTYDDFIIPSTWMLLPASQWPTIL
jgi:hypothetical protein